MLKNKRAVVFPTIKTDTANLPANVFSSGYLAETKTTFSDTYDSIDGLLGYIAERNRTKELSKRLNAQKDALDSTLDGLAEQEKIKTEEEAKRLKAKIKAEKKKMLSEIEKFELQAQDNSFVYVVEEDIQAKRNFIGVIKYQKNVLEEIQPFIESFADNLKHRRDYVQYCEWQRRSMKFIDKYLSQTV